MRRLTPISWLFKVCPLLGSAYKTEPREPQNSMKDELLKTPLYDLHLERGGRMVDFAGWSLPIRYGGIIEEHVHTRQACSLFDVSHMGRLSLTGGDCESFLNRLCTRNLSGAEVNRSYYSHLCREDGGILDDLIVSRFENSWGIVCNGSNRAKVLAWLLKHAEGCDVEITDETMKTAMVAIQGPRTLECLQGLVDIDLTSIGRYRIRVFDIMGMAITVYRCGYSGEDGFEVVVPAGITKMLLQRLLGSKDRPHAIIKPAGLGARDTLRIEAGLPLYGHELSEAVDPLTAGQSWCVDLSKDFIGGDAMRAMKEEGLPRRLVGLELEGRRIGRPHFAVLANGTPVGEVTSGTLSPTLGKSVAMAMVTSEMSAAGTTLEVDFGRRSISATVVKLPFYKRPKPVVASPS